MVMTLPMGGGVTFHVKIACVMGNISWPGNLVSSILRIDKYDIIYHIFCVRYHIFCVSGYVTTKALLHYEERKLCFFRCSS